VKTCDPEDHLEAGERRTEADGGDFIRLLQLEKELAEETPREIKVTWVEPEKRMHPKNRVQPAPIAKPGSTNPRRGSRGFRADRLRQEPGAVPGSDQAGVPEHGPAGLLGAPTYPMLRDATQTTLFEILDRSRIPYEHSKAEKHGDVEGHGVAILFRAVEGIRPATRHQPSLVRAGRTHLHRPENRIRDPCPSTSPCSPALLVRMGCGSGPESRQRRRVASRSIG